MHNKNITIKEIAKKLNVSISTVSRALNDHPGIGKKNRERIKQFAQEHNYQKNLTALYFKTGKSFTIGVIVPEITETFFSRAITGIEDVATENGYNVFFSQSHNDIEKEKEIISLYRKSGIDGLLVSLSKSTRNIEHFKELQESGVPVIFFDRIPKDSSMYTVSCDLFNSSKLLIDFLWEKGHKTIGLIKGPSSLNATMERMRGFMEGLNKKRVKTDPALFATSDLTREGTRKAMEDILSQKKKPTAIVAFNDYVALDAIQYIQEKTSMKINEDICFVSYANVPITNYIDVAKPIASIEQFPYEQGKLATELLLKILGDPQTELTDRHVVLEGKLIEHF
ncbi:LacI family DNA-binding transcriptional regulator [Haoranjiania flava]|uniref:LacI family transcriptional regulator n=1 Tax=Haoranjiania flava TaxID=1856322 RepID=A0AAE3IJI3_9BACT|nr:LacI family DNA-binding transcriptional regulator [Haoranjiania flava]MCU7693175.1 LacI family transcriptional regulator [Haoranjiania flava]